MYKQINFLNYVDYVRVRLCQERHSISQKNRHPSYNLDLNNTP